MLINNISTFNKFSSYKYIYMSNYSKYLKYKSKYLNLKKQIGGSGLENLVSIGDVLEIINQFNSRLTKGKPIVINFYIDKVNAEKVFDLNDRSNVFETLYQHKDDILNKIPFFVYQNVTGEIEKAVDDGGLTAHVFSLLSKFFTKEQSKYFIENGNFYTINVFNNLDTDKLFFIGQLFGCALKLMNTIEINLDPFLLYQMVHDDFDQITTEQIVKIINEFELKGHPYSCFKDPITNKLCDYDIDGNILETTEAKIKEAINTIKGRFSEANIKYFIDGFRSQINVKNLKLDRLPLKKFRELLYGSEIELTYDNLMKNLYFENFNQKQKVAFEEFIKENIKEDLNWIKLFLFSLTNKNKIPIGGYQKYKLTVKLTSLSKPILVHTCFNTMSLDEKTLNNYMNSQNKSDTLLYKYLNSKVLQASANAFDEE